MERGSDKHSPRADDELAHEVEGMVRAGRSTHAEEWKDPEPSGEDQPEVDRDPAGLLQGGTPPGMTHDDVEGRSDLARFLGLSAFPGTAVALREIAADNNAPDAVLARFDGLPEGRTYANVQELWQDMGGGVEDHRV